MAQVLEKIDEVSPAIEKANILLVDDRPANLTALEAILEPLGQNLIRANSGNEALRAVLKYELAVILMDVEMPDLNGIETAALIREREQSRGIPIIFITAVNTDEHYVFHGYSVGAVDYITKPFDPIVLTSKVAVFVELYQKERLLLERTRLLHEKQMEAMLLDQSKRDSETEQERIRLVNQMLEDRVRERTAELEAFCYSVSHDLRTPLRAIDAYAALVAETLDGETEAAIFLTKQRQATKKMDELIGALLSLSRISRTQLKTSSIDLTELVKSVTQELATEDEGREVVFTIQEDMELSGDPDLVRSLVFNLVSNSIKFTGKQPVAHIEIGSFERPDGKNVFFVKDDGIGFNPGFSQKLFKPFERLHSPDEFPGNGIGLATVDRIVKMHQGTAWAEGKVGEGAQFFFVL